jgi:hypothetical protein
MAKSPPKLDYSPPDSHRSAWVWVQVIVRVLAGFGVAAAAGLLLYFALLVYFFDPSFGGR